MGTNYYTKLNFCAHCQRFDEIHLGKSSFGWKFTLQWNGGKHYKNFNEMLEMVNNREIVDEYGKVISFYDFKTMVMRKQEEKLKPKGEGVKEIGGFYFLDTEFS